MLKEDKILSVSLPRAGHHYLVELLLATMGSQIEYINRPSGEECLIQGAALLMKHHDERGEIDPKQDAFYIIQHREPRGRILSESERQMSRKSVMREKVAHSGRAFWETWVANIVKRTIGFHDKWIVSPPPRSVVVGYDRICREPDRIVAEIVERIGAEPINDIGEVCAKLSRSRPSGSGDLGHFRRIFTPRDMTRSPFIPEDMLCRAVAMIQERCPIWRA